MSTQNSSYNSRLFEEKSHTSIPLMTSAPVAIPGGQFCDTSNRQNSQSFASNIAMNLAASLTPNPNMFMAPGTPANAQQQYARSLFQPSQFSNQVPRSPSRSPQPPAFGQARFSPQVHHHTAQPSHENSFAQQIHALSQHPQHQFNIPQRPPTPVSWNRSPSVSPTSTRPGRFSDSPRISPTPASALLQTLSQNPTYQQLLQNPKMLQSLWSSRMHVVQQQQQLLQSPSSMQARPPTPQSWHANQQSSWESPVAGTQQTSSVPISSSLMAGIAEPALHNCPPRSTAFLDGILKDVESATPQQLRQIVEEMKNELINRDEDISKYQSHGQQLERTSSELQKTLEAKSRVLQNIQSKCALVERQLRETEHELIALQDEQTENLGFQSQPAKMLSPARGNHKYLNIDCKHQLHLADMRSKRLKDELTCSNEKIRRLNAKIQSLFEENDSLIEAERGLAKWKEKAEEYHERMKGACEAQAFSDEKAKELSETLAKLQYDLAGRVGGMGKNKENRIAELEREVVLLKGKTKYSEHSEVDVPELRRRCTALEKQNIQLSEDLIRENYVHEQQVAALEHEYKFESYKERYHERALRCNMLEELIDGVIDLPHQMKPNEEVFEALASWFRELQQAQSHLRYACENVENEVNRRVQNEQSKSLAQIDDMNRQLLDAQRVIQRLDGLQLHAEMRSIVDDLVWKTVCSTLHEEPATQDRVHLPKQVHGQQRIIGIQKHEIDKLQVELRQFRDRHTRLLQQYDEIALIQSEEGRVSEEQVEQISSLQAKIQELNEKRAETEMKIIALETEIKSLPTHEETELGRREMDSLRTSHRNLSNKTRALEQEASQLRQQLQSKDQKLNELTSEVNRLRSENRRKLSSNMTKIDHLRSQLDNLQEMNTSLSTAKRSLEQEVEKLMEQIRRTDTERMEAVSNLREQLSVTKSELQSQRCRYETLEEENCLLDSRAKQHESLASAVSSKLGELQARYSSVASERAALERQVQSGRVAGLSSSEVRDLYAKYEHASKVLKEFEKTYRNEPVNPVQELNEKLKLQRKCDSLLDEHQRTEKQHETLVRDLRGQISQSRADKLELREIAKTIHNEGQTKLTNIAKKLKFMSSLAISSYKVLRTEQEFIRSNHLLSKQLQYLNSQLNSGHDKPSEMDGANVETVRASARTEP